MAELKNGFLTAEEVMDILQIKQSKAYQIIRQLNKEEQTEEQKGDNEDGADQ